MFAFAFLGWRKASKCKKLIKQVQCRLKLLKNKNSVITNQFRQDIVLLLQNGNHQAAFNRVDQIVKDESRMAAYQILDNFCEFVLLNLSYIRKHKECPNDVNEAVSSLVFASARCGDLPELQLIRKLFGERYGRSFVTTAVDLYPGNLVNLHIKEKLSTTCVTDDEKQRMIHEIVRDCLQPELLALEWHQNQVIGREVVQVHDDVKKEQHKKEVVNGDETNRKDLHYSNSVTSTSSECLPQLPEERIVYLDDVVELCSSTTTEGDQRLFKFTLSNKEISKQNYENQIDVVQNESWSDDHGNSSSITEDYKHEKSAWKQRKMEKYWGSEETTDKEIEWASFYKKPGRRGRKRRQSPSSSADMKFTRHDGLNSKEEEEKCEKMEVKKEGLYLRAVTMPRERSKEREKDEVNLGRTNSCPYKEPSHVHPKLPDYDDIAAKFIALKRERQQNNTLRP